MGTQQWIQWQNCQLFQKGLSTYNQPKKIYLTDCWWIFHRACQVNQPPKPQAFSLRLWPGLTFGWLRLVEINLGLQFGGWAVTWVYLVWSSCLGSNKVSAWSNISWAQLMVGLAYLGRYRHYMGGTCGIIQVDWQLEWDLLSGQLGLFEVNIVFRRVYICDRLVQLFGPYIEVL